VIISGSSLRKGAAIMIINRKELARRIAHRGHYDIGDIEQVLKIYEDIFVEALENGDEIKQGKLFKVFFQSLPEKRAFDGLNRRYFTREPKRVPKFKSLTRIDDIELPVEEAE
jgi:nucleoid DNA-binding protein